MNRRSFLAGAAAAVATPLIPVAPAEAAIPVMSRESFDIALAETRKLLAILKEAFPPIDWAEVAETARREREAIASIPLFVGDA